MRFLYKTTYEQDIRLLKHDGYKTWYGLLLAFLIVAPWILPEYWLAQLTFVMVYGIAGLGLMLLAGFTGQFSIGHAAFLGVGAYTEAVLGSTGWPFPLTLAASALLSASVGAIVGLPALRLKGLYLGIATLAFAFIVQEVLSRWESVTGGNSGISVKAPAIGAWSLGSGVGLYALCTTLAVLSTLFVLNLLRSPVGRAFVAIRDSEVSAQSMGIQLARYKTLAFATSAGLAGIGGALYAHKVQFISPDQFGIEQSIELLLLVVVGGLGSVHGAFFGAVFLITMPQLLTLAKDHLPTSVSETNGLQGLAYGIVLVLFVLLEPMGIYGRWIKLRTYFDSVPFYRRGMFKRQKTFQKSDRLK